MKNLTLSLLAAGNTLGNLLSTGLVVLAERKLISCSIKILFLNCIMEQNRSSRVLSIKCKQNGPMILWTILRKMLCPNSPGMHIGKFGTRSHLMLSQAL